MKNKMMTGAIITIVLLSAAVLFWYFSPSNISIASLEEPQELVIGQLSSLTVTLQNNASEDVNVTINVKNAFVDEKGMSLKGSIFWVEDNSSWFQINATEKPEKEVRLKPGSNRIDAQIGYQLAGTQTVEVDVYQMGKLADSRTIELNVLKPTIEVLLEKYESTNGTNEIHSVYGYLQLRGKGYAPDVAVNISVIDELTNKTVKTVTRGYSLHSEDDIPYSSVPLVIWERRTSINDPVTGARIDTRIETYSPTVVIELANNESSTEKYARSPVVVKGKLGDRYKVVVTATWVDQVISSEMMIPPNKKTVEEAITDAQANVSFRILQPDYIPEGYRMNTEQTSGTKFHDGSSELELASLFYIKGKESLNLQELLVIKDDTDVSESISKTPYKYVDINGIQGRFLEGVSGSKSLNWKVGSLRLNIYAHNGSGFAGTSLGMDEMIKIARSVK